MDFFDCRTEEPDDVQAIDFVPTWPSFRQALTEPPKYGEYRTAVNKLAAHLTYIRVTYAEAGGFPPSREMTEFLTGAAAVFARQLTHNQLASFGGLV